MAILLSTLFIHFADAGIKIGTLKNRLIRSDTYPNMTILGLTRFHFIVLCLTGYSNVLKNLRIA